jgi:predicted nuclease of predicted toxin-antitoxin system
MVKYLIDVNLPYYFSLWNDEKFIHQKDNNDEAKDDEIWKYALDNDLTIITKDSDFSNKILFHEPPPKVIHLKFGNLKMKDFFYTI